MYVTSNGLVDINYKQKRNYKNKDRRVDTIICIYGNTRTGRWNRAEWREIKDTITPTSRFEDNDDIDVEWMAYSYFCFDLDC